jgi:DNA-binding LytR/AlgR family response regulator
MEKLKILILEDNPLTANALAAMVEDFGYEVVGIAASGQEALQLFETGHPDVAILDIRVEGDMNGIEVGKAIVQKRPIPIIYLTAFSEEYYEDAKITHPAAFFSKPYNERDLGIAIDLAINNFTQNKTTFNHPDATQELPNIYFKPDCLWLKIKSGDAYAFERLQVSDILWVEADNVYLNIHTDCLKRPYVVILGLGKFLEHAHYPELVQAHRSHVINVRHVTSFSNTEVTFHCGKKVAMSKTYAPTVIEAILNWKKG